MKTPFRILSTSLLLSLAATGGGHAQDYAGLGFFANGLGNGTTSLADNYAAFSSPTYLNQSAHYFDLFVDYTQPIAQWPSSANFGASSLAASPLKNVTPVVSVGLVDKPTGMPGGTYNESASVGMLNAVANGTYDSVFRGVLQNIYNNGYHSIYLRIAWEQNGNFEPWYATGDTTSAAAYVAAWQRVANIAHNVGGAGVVGMTVKTVWSPACINYTAQDTDITYPGDSYVDVVGPDLYSPTRAEDLYDYTTFQNDANYTVWAANPVNREHYWDYPSANHYAQAKTDGGYGLARAITFAIAHNKPFALSETGAGYASGTYGPADDGDFPIYLANRLTSAIENGLTVAFVNVWNENPGDGNWKFTDGSRPNEAAAWKQFAATMATGIFTDQADADVGTSSPAGSANYVPTTGAYTLKGAGTDIWGSSDGFNFLHQNAAGTQTLIACVTGLSNTSGNAKTGVMLRDSMASNAIFAMTAVQANGYVALFYRPNTGGAVNIFAGQSTGITPSPTTPIWVKLTRSGSNFTAAYATTVGRPADANWLPLGSSLNVVYSGSTTTQGGLIACSRNNGTLTTATFAGNGYSDSDIGTGAPEGLAEMSGTGIYTIKGGGGDIWGTADQFNFESKSLSGDQTLITRVTGLANTNANAKAGVMFRDSLAAGASYVLLNVNPAGSVAMTLRASTGGNSAYVTGASTVTPSATTPVWLKLVKSGTNYTAYYATTVGTPGASDWVALTSQAVTFTNPTYKGGLAVCSHVAGTLTTATFDNVTP